MSAPPPGGARDRCRILYRDIGDYLTREDKFAMLREWRSIAGIDDWREIAPDAYHDWIDKRDRTFETFYPLGSKQAKAGKTDDAVFRLFSNGYKTGRDAYIYNFSRESCAENSRRMVDDYMAALREREARADKTADVDDITSRHRSHVRWDQDLKNNLKRRKETAYSPDNIWAIQHRPFVKQHCYVDYVLAQRKYQMDDIFPRADSENRAICVPTIGDTKPFSALMVDCMPDLNILTGSQCFPRYRYRNPSAAQGALPGIAPKVERVDNISDTALAAFRDRYGTQEITKDAIFDYVYGILHAPDYRGRFAADLAKALPHVPFAPDFRAFADAGAKLADLHLGYETGPEYPLVAEPTGKADRLFGTSRMKLTGDGNSVLVVNDSLQLAGIPAAAHRYEVNGRTPLGWFIDRYRVARDKQSGIVNDPNAWFPDTAAFTASVKRIVHLSVETARIVEALPKALEDGRDATADLRPEAGPV